MPEYVLNRTYTLRSTAGHVLNFVKGQPTYVPPILERQVTELGGEPVGGVRMDLVDEEAKPLPPAPEGADRETQIMDIFKKLEARNMRGDFTGQGRPNLSVLKDLLGFEVVTRERDVMWEKHLAARAEA